MNVAPLVDDDTWVVVPTKLTDDEFTVTVMLVESVTGVLPFSTRIVGGVEKVPPLATLVDGAGDDWTTS